MEDWDPGYNITGIDAKTHLKIRESEMLAVQKQEQLEEEQRRISSGYFEIPFIPNDIVVQQFPFQAERYDPIDARDYPIATGTVNRIIWICYNCGYFGYKNSLRELFKCYVCQSRDIQIMRAGELPALIRAAITHGTQIGINMRDVFQRRQERIREIRRVKRDNANRLSE